MQSLVHLSPASRWPLGRGGKKLIVVNRARHYWVHAESGPFESSVTLAPWQGRQMAVPFDPCPKIAERTSEFDPISPGASPAGLGNGFPGGCHRGL